MQSSSTSASSNSSVNSRRLLLDLSHTSLPPPSSSSSLSVKELIKWERLENNINDWLDDQNIFIAPPETKELAFYQQAKNTALTAFQKLELSIIASEQPSN